MRREAARHITAGRDDVLIRFDVKPAYAETGRKYNTVNICLLSGFIKFPPSLSIGLSVPVRLKKLSPVDSNAIGEAVKEDHRCKPVTQR